MPEPVTCAVCGSYHGPNQTHLFGELGKLVQAVEPYVPQTMTAARYIELKREAEAHAATRAALALSQDELRRIRFTQATAAIDELRAVATAPASVRISEPTSEDRAAAAKAQADAIAGRWGNSPLVKPPARDEPWNDPARWQEWLRRSMRWPTR